MIKNHIKIAWRVLQKNRLYTVLNLTGLTMGITAFLMIALFIQDELSYDRFFPGHESVFRISTHWGNYASGGYATAPPSLGPRIEEDIPEVQAVTRLLKWNDFTIQPGSGPNADQVFRETGVLYTEPGFFEVFDLEAIAGDRKEALSKSSGVVITASTAKKYFGNLPPEELIGKVLLMGSSGTTPKEILAVLKDIPAQSHLQFDMLVYEPGMHEEIFRMDSWNWAILHTYIKTAEEKREVVAEKLDVITSTYAIPSFSGADESSDFNFQLMPVEDIHLHSHLLREHQANSYKSYIYLFSLVAGFVLLLACINFMNLATAKAGLRAMEVGVRKVLGSGKSQLVYQFLTEAFILVLISVISSLVFVKLLNGVFNGLSGKDLRFDLLDNGLILWTVPFLVLLLTLLSGFYPAFYLSSFRPLVVIKKLSGGKNGSGFRNGLVVFQFATSLTLIICTLMVQRQMGFIQHSDPGYDKEQLLLIHSDGEIRNGQREDFKNQFASNSSVRAVSFSTGVPMSGQFHMRSFSVLGEKLEMGMNWYEADADYISTYGFRLIAGRNFSSTPGSDVKKVILNQTAAQTLGIPHQPIGQLIVKNKGAEDEATLEVIGVLEDFNFETYRNGIKPLVIEYMHDYFLRDFITVRMQGADMEKGIEELESGWRKFQSRVPMNYSFLDEDFGRVYQSELKMTGILQTLTGISMVIACLGLFGLTAYTTHMRIKEIGVRKVFGASMSEIFVMLASSYMKLLLLAALVAVPLALYFMESWLQDFAFRIGLELWLIGVAILASFSLALLVIFFQSFKSIRANPVNSLKNE